MVPVLIAVILWFILVNPARLFIYNVKRFFDKNNMLYCRFVNAI